VSRVPAILNVQIKFKMATYIPMHVSLISVVLSRWWVANWQISQIFTNKAWVWNYCCL